MQAGLLSREIPLTGVPTLLTEAEGNIASERYREPLADPARSKTPCMCGISMRENRESPVPARLGDRRAGRSGNAEAVRLR